MRKLLLLAVTVVACSKAETPPPDTTAAMAPAPAPAMLTAADVAGTWNGVGMLETGDSVVSRWTAEEVSDSTGKLTIVGSKEAIPYSRKLDADSMIVTSSPYTDPTMPKGPKVTFRSIGRLKDGKLIGTSANRLAAKPDSVVGRGRWEATRAPAK